MVAMEYDCGSSQFSPYTQPLEFWREAAERREGSDYVPWSDPERATLRDFARRVEAPGAVMESIEALGDGETLVVCAGQQTGLFLSPLYIIYKAAGAVLWARHLSDLLERPVKPLFWIASEDHDYDEVCGLRYLDASGTLQRWEYDAEVAAGTSMFDVGLERDRIASFMDQLRQHTRETDFREAVIERWMSHAEQSDNLEDFFARGLMDFFGDAGLIPFSSNDASLRKRAASILRSEIENPGETSRRVKETGGKAIHRKGDEVNFFLYRRGVRAKVRLEDQEFQVEDIGSNETIETLSREALLEELDQSPLHFSPNVITRPVVQDGALPVVAMLGGPGERRYLAQLREAEIYSFFEVPASVVLERPRALLLEPSVERSLEKLGLDQVLLKTEDTAHLREAAARASDFGEALKAVESMEDRAENLFEDLRPKMGDLMKSPAVESALDKTLQNWKKGASKMAKRVRREIEQRDEAAQHHLDRLVNTALPDGHPQERVIGPLAPFEVHYGTKAFAEFILDNLQIDRGADLQVLRLSDID
ncbi:MAG: bacillithiol biosynthesis cysteine-adding enzyme BshC [Candidatus Sumerlaeota bacterium]